MSEHTPGPWTLFQVGDTNEHLCPATTDGTSILTLTREGNSSFAAVLKDADARLIAAAPELLSALKDVLRIATAASNGVTGNQPRLERARAAIRKATEG